MTALAFLDTETTGLDPDRHEVWEVALILRDSEGVEIERVWQLPVDLNRADVMALNIGRWYDRRLPWPVYGAGHVGDEAVDDARRIEAALRGEGSFVVPPDRMDDWVALFAELMHGAHLVGAVPSFDDAFLKRLLRQFHACPGWHYHLIDVEALAVGWLAANDTCADSSIAPPWDSEELSRAVGVDPDQFERHSALGDARWVKAIYDAVMT